jgi:hypothetical protein
VSFDKQLWPAMRSKLLEVAPMILESIELEITSSKSIQKISNFYFFMSFSWHLVGSEIFESGTLGYSFSKKKFHEKCSQRSISKDLFFITNFEMCIYEICYRNLFIIILKRFFFSKQFLKIVFRNL